MNKTVYRYVVPFTGPQTFTLTSPPRAVSNTQHEDGLEFWAENYPNRAGTEVTLDTFGTGHPVPEGAIYIGTAPRTSLGLVFHLYEI
jgi:hypothetical protein